MKRGPKPKPTVLKILQGNPGKRPLPEQEPKPLTGLPRCPKHVTGEARKLWLAIGKQLEQCGIMSVIDGQALELLVANYVEYCEATVKVAQSGPIWLEKQEDSKIPKFAYSPFWVQAQRAQKKLLVMLREFGMTPSARSSIKTASPLVEHTDEPAAKYFGS